MANENDEIQQTNNIHIGNSVLHCDADANESKIIKDQSNSEYMVKRITSVDESNVCMRGNLNDLVADLCLNGTRAYTSSASLGDCTNIRATLGPTISDEGTLNKNDEQLHDNAATAGTSQPTAHVQAPTQNSSFSFKHFLNSSNTMTAPSTTVTSLDPVSVVVSTSQALPSIHALQTSTGARPKVPQSASITATSLSSLMSSTQDATSAATKMKRSPRFSSFDSQASLAEYVVEAPDNSLDSKATACGNSNSGFRFYNSQQSGENCATTNSDDYERQNVTRSYSNYDIPLPSASPRRRGGVCSNRPNKLALNTNSSKLKLDLPVNSANSSLPLRPMPSNGNDFPAAAAASALPDFVQDHWMDSWYAHEMHLNSPPNSPIGFVEERGCAGAVGGGSLAGIDTSGAASYGVPTSNNVMGGERTTESASSSKMLPDFLSDGPIIHSSQRLADVAAGLPSNTMGSPEDNSMTTQLSRLRIENERLQRELNEARIALNEQTRRGNELERQFQERQRNDAYSRTLSHNMSEVEAILDKNKKRTAAAQCHVTKLKQQVTQLTAEVETLRRENEELREEGAVGGCSTTSCDRSYATAAAGARGRGERPSKSQQISKELRKAALNAENNLKQLLTGVENLRQMAADIDNSQSSDLYPDFLDDCDEFEDYAGGPAL